MQSHPTFGGKRSLWFYGATGYSALLKLAHSDGCDINLDDVTYFLGHETVVASEGRKGLPRWVESAFAFMERNSVHVSDFFRLPAEFGRGNRTASGNLITKSSTSATMLRAPRS